MTVENYLELLKEGKEELAKLNTDQVCYSIGGKREFGIEYGHDICVPAHVNLIISPIIGVSPACNNSDMKIALAIIPEVSKGEQYVPVVEVVIKRLGEIWSVADILRNSDDKRPLDLSIEMKSLKDILQKKNVIVASYNMKLFMKNAVNVGRHTFEAV